MVEWNKEVEGMNTNAGNYLKFEAGTYKITFLDNGSEPKEKVFPDGKKQVQVNFKVRYEHKDGISKDALWSVNKTTSLMSIYGQIALLGRFHGDLTNKTITVLVIGSGQNIKYTVVEAVELAQKETERRKSLSGILN